MKTTSDEAKSWDRRLVLKTCYAALTCLTSFNATALAAYPERTVRIDPVAQVRAG